MALLLIGNREMMKRGESNERRKLMIKIYDSGTVYKPIVPLEEEVFVYVRKLRGKEVGFSALPTATRNPDFSNCGIFWVRQKDFNKIFQEHIIDGCYS